MPTEIGPFEQVYDRHVVGIYRYVYARVGNRPDAEDLTAQIFMRAVEQLDTGRDPGQIAAWLYRVAQNAIADYWRAFYRLPLVGVDHVAPGWEPAQEAPQSRAAPDDRAAVRVESLLRALPERYRRVLELRFLQRLSVAETAAAMGVTHGNAKVLQYRALRRAALLGDGADG
ncbi:MAG: RNA polymerase sigma factor [Candidatus Limnocylindria bacterium]